VQALLVVAGEVDRLALAVLVRVVRGGELGSQDDEVAVLLLLHPLADPALGLLVLIVVGRVNHVTASFVEGV